MAFDEIYLKTDGDIVENPSNTEADVDALIVAAALLPRDRILDLCCGQGRHTIALARRGFHDVMGLDASRHLLDLARRRARDAGVQLNFVEADARDCALEDESFDCVAILGNSFGYFAEAAEDAAMLRRARDLLRPGGRLALDLVDGNWLRRNFEERSWEWLEEGMLVCRQRMLSKDGERLVTRETVWDSAGGIIADRFLAERLYTRGAISAALKSVGFRKVCFREPAMSRSDRGSDLGMMARRLLVIADAAKVARSSQALPPRTP